MPQKIRLLNDYERALIVKALRECMTGNALDTTKARDLARSIALSPSVELLEVHEPLAPKE
jgi:hypothetical protein